MGKKEYHGFEIEMIDLTGYDEIVTSSGTCSYINTIWTDYHADVEIKNTCTAELCSGEVNQNDYNGLYIGTSGT